MPRPILQSSSLVWFPMAYALFVVPAPVPCDSTPQYFSLGGGREVCPAVIPGRPTSGTRGSRGYPPRHSARARVPGRSGRVQRSRQAPEGCSQPLRPIRQGGRRRGRLSGRPMCITSLHPSMIRASSLAIFGASWFPTFGHAPVWSTQGTFPFGSPASAPCRQPGRRKLTLL